MIDQKISKSPQQELWRLLLGFTLSMLLVLGCLVLWTFRNAWDFGMGALLILSTIMLFAVITYLKKVSFQVALYRLIAIIAGMVAAMLLLPRTLDSVLEDALLRNKTQVLQSVPRLSRPFIEKFLVAGKHLPHISLFLGNADKETAVSIVQNSYAQTEDFRLRLYILQMAIKIDDKRIHELFVDALSSKHLEEIMLAANYLMMSDTSEEEIVAVVKGKLPLFIESLKNAQYRESVAIFLSVFFGSECLPQILTALEQDPRPEFVDVLGRIGDNKTTDILIHIASTTPDEMMLQEAIIALGFLRDEKALAFLKQFSPSEKNATIASSIQLSLENLRGSLSISQIEVTEEHKELVAQARQSVNNFLASLKSYRLKTNCKIWVNHDPANLMSDMSGKMAFAAENLFLLDQECTLHPQQQTNYIFTSFDGEHQWYYAGDKKFTGRYVNKFILKDFPFPQRPFDVWPIPGTGLMPGEDYAGTIRSFLLLYDFDSCVDEPTEKVTTLHGRINKNKMMEYLALSGQIQILKDQKLLDAMAKSHQEILIFIRDDGAVMGWDIISHQQASVLPNMYPDWVSKVSFTIQDIQINPEIEKSAFQVDENTAARAIDMGANIVKIFKKRLKNREKALSLIKEIRDNE